MPSVIILGAKGRFGRAVATAFKAAGWTVTEQARHWPDADRAAHRVALSCDDASALTQAVMGHDVIVNALNPPYPEWSVQVPRLTDAVLEAARVSGATVMIPGNVYNYGADMPPVLSETTPWRAQTRKGRIRIRMETAYRESGVQTIVLRGGDFLEAERTGNWFDSHIAAKAWTGKLTYPGARGVVHTWAYLPDMARAMVELADIRSSLGQFEEFGFGGYAVDGDTLIAAVEAVTGKRMRVASMPWSVMRLMGLFSPLVREVMEMRYLWDVPHRVDQSKLEAALPAFQSTPFETAIAACLAPHAPGATSALAHRHLA
ncbi:NAD(P)H-binding protein [uncultured Tateyamaria sp.]|uniref:NAD-dependent epimerase/dehydratase family protein n=1 Tax=uncultured Tateyamaria sp. TaxID=455651 RepID=UPI002621F970|nr:NAD(P)H-binding protein [uncultured Tateyamaria sp.]